MLTRFFTPSRRFLAAALWLAAMLAGPGGAPAAESPPALAMPIDCAVGKNCWIVNYVDLDPTAQVRDYACGKAAYDGHKGTDIAIRDRNALEKGVPVRAAAAGVVEGVRDNMPDLDVGRPGGREAVAGRECGNGVLIDHGGGWTTQYCHMRMKSVRVATGDKVQRGQVIGMVGISGLAEFPHLHIQVEKDGRIVDPFAGPDRVPGACGLGVHPLWDTVALAKLPYAPTAISNLGFAQAVPKPDQARDGLLDDGVLSRRAPVLILWADIYWVEKGDVLKFRILGPEGETIFAHESALDRTQARRFAYGGKKRKGLFWEKGRYTGEVTLERKGAKGPERFVATREIEIK